MPQVALPRLLFGSPIFVDDDEIELVVELLRQLVVTADDCNMMDS